MARKKNREEPSSAVDVKGFFRLQIVDPDESVVGDSGWQKNTVTDVGLYQYLVKAIASQETPVEVSHVALGSATAAVSASASSLPGEWHSSVSNIWANASTNWRKTVQADTGSKSCTFLATFAASGWHTHTSAALQIANIGLYNAATATGSLFAGNTFNSSGVASNQAVNVTYTINFSG